MINLQHNTSTKVGLSGFTAVGIVVLILAGFALPDDIQPVDALQNSTIHEEIQAGDALVLTLPAELGDGANPQQIDRYQPLRIPATSWTVGRAFFWRPAEADAGEHEFQFVAMQNDTSADTLTLVVDVLD